MASTVTARASSVTSVTKPLQLPSDAKHAPCAVWLFIWWRSQDGEQLFFELKSERHECPGWEVEDGLRACSNTAATQAPPLTGQRIFSRGFQDP